MSFNSRVRRGRLAPAAVACALTATLIASAADQQVDMLDEVIVTAKTVRPLEDFVNFPDFDSVAISPNGKLLAIGWQDDKNYMRELLTVNFPSMKREDSQIMQIGMSVNDIRWASDTRILVQPDWPVKGFRRIRELVGSLFVVDVDRHQLRVLQKEPTVRGADPLREKRDQDEASAIARAKREARGKDDFVGDHADRNALGPVQLISATTVKPEHMLFQTTRSTTRAGKSDGYGAFYLDMKEWEQTRVSSMPVPDARFVTGPDGHVAIATGKNDDFEPELYYLPPKARAQGTAWELVSKGRSGDRGLRPVAWMGTGEEYYAFDGRATGTNAIVAWDAESNTQRQLYRNPNADMEAFALDPSGKPYVFSGTDHFPVYWYPDPEHPLAKLHKMVAKRARDEQVDIVNSTTDMSVAVVRVSAGRRAPIFNIVNVATGQAIYGMRTYPKLKETRLEPVDPIEFRARDGLMIRGYLTTPTNASNEPMKGVPLIVIAHDGPAGEPATDYRYEFERQLFASRGYAVLQVNHRGSRGRGLAFERAGDGKWGREVQEDFGDAVRWAIKDGVASPDRVCIYGTGYGAYSAFMAASRDPSLYKCIIGISGVYDLDAMMDEYKPLLPGDLRQVLGSDESKWKIRSPVNVASTIKSKVLLISQPGDEKVPPKQTVSMGIALKAANVTFATDTIGTTWRTILLPADRTLVYTRLIKFLDQNIGPEAK